MASAAVCPRCREQVRPPGLMTPGWRCDRHGVVAPLHLLAPNARTLAHLSSISGVPVWLPHPPPTSWLITGLGYAGSNEVCASVVMLSGPSPVGGAADVLIVSEEPGVGLGAGYAGLPNADAGPLPTRPSDASVLIGAHPTRLWQVPCPADRVTYVGEAEGWWLWLVLWPQDADVLLLERLTLCDVRSHLLPPLEFGAQAPRLTALAQAGTPST